ncbi:MAG TPA: CHRD domain-containing protein [Ktedonobacteraceae bacterium]|nr:CHRD domain-containing protein [Ktedonobacteraceae bacterium]
MANMDRRTIKGAIGIVLILASMLIVGACATAATPPSPSGAPTLPTQIQVTLDHSPVGTSDLTWNAANQTLTVKVAMTGLAPSSTHPEHIHAGDCSSDGAIVYTLKPIVADSLGAGTSETTITGVKDGIPAKGWYINVHNGPNLSPDIQAAPIACANITNSTTSTKNNQSVHVTLGGTPAANESASGTAQLSIESGKLTVKLTVTGLAPNSTHIAHIHKGSCEAQGAVLYPLTSVVADASGKGTSTTTVPNVSSIPASGWYVNVHRASTKDDLSTQTGFDPITCGNVVTK